MYKSDRNKLIQLIHVARRELVELQDDEIYRSMLKAITGKSSCADMRDNQLQDVLNHMKKSGFSVQPKGKSSRPLAQDAEHKKIRALWLFLHDLGVVKNPSEAALSAYVKRLTGVDALQWINGSQAEKVIESQKKWAMRFLPDAVQHLVREVSLIPMSNDERATLTSFVEKACLRGTFDPMQSAWERLNTKTGGCSNE